MTIQTPVRFEYVAVVSRSVEQLCQKPAENSVRQLQISRIRICDGNQKTKNYQRNTDLRNTSPSGFNGDRALAQYRLVETSIAATVGKSLSKNFDQSFFHLVSRHGDFSGIVHDEI